MFKKLSWMVFVAGIVVGVFVGTAVFAQENAAPAQPSQADVAAAEPQAVVAAAEPAQAEGAKIAQPADVPVGTVVSTVSTDPKMPPAVMEVEVNPVGNVTLDFREADIRNVLKVLAYKSGVNIILGPEVVGLVNIQLKNVPWQKALDVILSTYGYSYEKSGDIITVTTVEILKKRREDSKLLAEQEPVSTETFFLSFGKAEDVIKSLEKMKTARGSVNFDKRTNALIVSDVETNLKYIREVVERLDAVTPQVLIEARIVETTLDKNDTMGIDWNLSATVRGGARATTLPWTNDFTNRYTPSGETQTSLPGMVYGTLNATGLSATLDLLKSRGNTKILSNPQIVTLDNQLAKVQVGQQYPMPDYTSNAETGVLQVSGWTYMDIGIIFEVTPHVNNANMVTLDIKPTITGILTSYPETGVDAEEATMPVLSNESVSTTVMIKDSETLVIAGLIKDTVTKTENKVPILGYIPFLGWAFQHTEDVHQKTDLMIFLTPHIITQTVDSKSVKK